MPAKKNAVKTPLHLLQQLSKSLVVHLEQACADAQKDAEILLAQIEKQRGKTQEKLIKARAKLDEAGSAGKSKAQGKARAKLAELDDILALLQSRQSETLSYLADLKRDAAQSLSLAQGVSQVEKAAAQALASRSKSGSSTNTPAPQKSTTARAPASAKPAATSARSAAPKRATGKATQAAAPRVLREADNTTANPATPLASGHAKSSLAEATAAAAKPAAARKPATSRRPAAGRKPASAGADGAVQVPPSASS